MAEPIDPPEWLTTICAGLAGSAWPNAGPATPAAAAPPSKDTRSRRRRRLVFIVRSLPCIPESTLGVAHGGGNTEGPWSFGRRTGHRSASPCAARFIRATGTKFALALLP